MQRRLLRTALFLFCLSLGFAPPHAASAADSAAHTGAVEQGKAAAGALLAQGKAAEAYALYSRLLREEPEDDIVNLGLARSAQAAGRLNQAVMAYLRLLEKYPREGALHRELAQVYMAFGDREKAEEHLRLDASLSRDDADSLLDRLDRRYDRLQVHGTLRAGMLFDSNANQGTASNTMNLGNWRGVTVEGAKAKESFGGYFGTQIDVGYRLDQTGPWWIVGDVLGYVRGNANNDLGVNTSREWQWGRASGGFRFLDGLNLLDLRLKSEMVDYEFMQHASSTGPELTYVHALRPWVQLITRGGVDSRDYSSDSSRNGAYWTVGQYARFFFSADNHELLLGGRWHGGEPEKSDYAYDGWEALAQIRFKLPLGFELSPYISYNKEDYHGPATPLEASRRHDERLRTGVGLTYAINEAWKVELSYQYTNNDSRSNLYCYEQHITSLGMSWNF